jgi:hypothetical protein
VEALSDAVTAVVCGTAEDIDEGIGKMGGEAKGEDADETTADDVDTTVDNVADDLANKGVDEDAGKLGAGDTLDEAPPAVGLEGSALTLTGWGACEFGIFLAAVPIAMCEKDPLGGWNVGIAAGMTFCVFTIDAWPPGPRMRFASGNRLSIVSGGSR